MIMATLRLAVAFMTTYELGWITYRRYFHPLRSVPGPFLASVTRLWIVFVTARGDMEKTQRALHKKHGYLIRIAPNEVACSDPEAIKVIYSTKKVFNKTDFYDIWAPPNVAYAGHFPTRKEKEHAERRRIVSTAYSMFSVLESEEAIDSCTEKWCKSLLEVAKQNSTVDLRYLINMHTFNVISELLYNGAFNVDGHHVEDGGCMESIAAMLALFSIGGTLPSYLTKIYMLFSILLFPSVRRTLKVVRRLSIASEKAVWQRKQEIEENHDENRDVVRKFFDINAEKGAKFDFTAEHVRAEAQSALFAGSDTSSIAITGVLYYLMQNPKTYQKLTAEIDDAVDRGTLSLPVSYADALKLPYLKACINESMRLHPSVALPMPRVVSEGGATVSGVYFPEGYHIGINPAVIQYDKEVFGSDAEDFNPNRWLEGDTAKMDRTMLQFGAGTRTCIGRNIALSQIYKLVPHVLRLFTIRLADPDKDLQTKNYWFNKQIGIRVLVKERTFTMK
ncbi:cytochrome P450 [Rhexocercosporidium sp. MPI-PUGE-AT-0058]|nr:cytochrome P450 [Rhexocercosporidium sp. MPI-PUGE-AT-0058]